MAYRKYNIIIVSMVVAILLLCALFNVTVDPTGIWRTPQITKFNYYKPEQDRHDRLIKAVELTRCSPEMLLLGSSRVQAGIDTRDLLKYGYSSAYNAALSAATIDENLTYLKHALHNNPNLKAVIIGLDFENFLEGGPPYHTGFKMDRMEKKEMVFTDIIESSLSFDAALSSLKTVLSNITGKKSISYFDVGGSRTDEYQNRVVENDRAGRTLVEAFLMPIGKEHINRAMSQEKMAVFKEIVKICREKNIKLLVFITPYHSMMMEKIRNEKQWSNFVLWKDELSHVYPIWDFSNYSQVSTENIASNMQYYWEASHYKKTVGRMILSRMFNMSEETVPNDFGVLLTNSTFAGPKTTPPFELVNIKAKNN